MPLTRWKTDLLVGWIGAVTGISFLLLATGFTAFEGTFLIQSSQTDGIIVANVPSKVPANMDANTPELTVLCPEFQYETSKRAKYTKTGSMCTDPPIFAVGDRVKVNYLTSDESSGQIDRFAAKWRFAVGFSIPALVLILIGLFFLRRVRSQGHTLDLTNYWE